MTQGIRVLVVEDELALARAIAITLQARGYEVATAGDGREALDLVARTRPDLILLDLGLPRLDGMSVLQALRGWSDVPVVVLSARSGAEDIIGALDAGADDYVGKPFDMSELLARLRAASRRPRAPRARPKEASVLWTPDFVVDISLRTVTKDGTRVRLTPTEWHLLEVLVRAAGQVVTRGALLDELRGPGVSTEPHYLRVYVAQLRRKLEPSPAAPRYLLTEAGVGYRLRVHPSPA